jgi:hypothetical protein
MNKQHNMLFAGSVFGFAFVYWFAARGAFVMILEFSITWVDVRRKPLVIYDLAA